MADFYAPQNPGLAAFIQPYLSWRERQANESRLADFILPKAIPDYLMGLAYGTNPSEPPLTSWRSTLAYGLPAAEALGIAPALRPLARGGLAAYGALERRMLPPAGQLNMMVGPGARAEFLNQADPAVRAMITDQLKMQGLRDVQITDGVIRDEIARRNAATMLGLPAENTAADRAAAMGFDTPAYHGSKSDFSKIDKKYFGSGTGQEDTGQGFFASSSPLNASEYADFASGSDKYKGSALAQFKDLRKRHTVAQFIAAELRQGSPDLSNEIDRFLLENPLNLPKVYPLSIKAGSNKHVDWSGRPWDTSLTASLYKKEAKKYPGITNRDIRDYVNDNWGNPPATTYVQFSPQTVRSRFAAFDPARAKEADILAGLAGASLIPALTLQDYFRQD